MDDFSSGDIAAAYEAASGASPAPAPETSPPSPDSASVPATAAPGETATVPGSTGDITPPGPIPFERHKAALENARQEWRQKYGWAEAVDPQDFAQIRSIATHFTNKRPLDGLRAMIAEIRKDPAVDAEFRSFQGQMLASLRQAPPPQTVNEPSMVQVQLEDGSVVALPRDPAAWLAYHRQQWEASIDQKLQPLEEARQQQVRHAEQAAQEAMAERFGAQAYADVKSWIGMDTPEAQKGMAVALEQYQLPENASPEAILLAAAHYHRTVVVPSLQAKERAAIVSSQTTKAKAGTINPASPTSSHQAPRSVKDMDWRESVEHEWNRRAAMSGAQR